MKKKILSLILVISVVLLSINLIPVSANQISVIGAATGTTSTQQTVDIPVGDYHVYIETDGDLKGFYGDAIGYCTATSGTETLFSWSTGSTILASETWTGQITFSSLTAITFTFEIQGGSTSDEYYMNFQIVFTDVDVATITKSSIISEAPYAFEMITLALIAVAFVYIQKRRGK